MAMEGSGGFFLKPSEKILLQEEFPHMWVNSPSDDWRDGQVVLTNERLFIQSYWAQRENERRRKRGEGDLLVDMDIIPLSAIENLKKETIKAGLMGKKYAVLRVSWRKQARWFEVRNPDAWVSAAEQRGVRVEPTVVRKPEVCSECGADLIEGAKYCGRCGTQVKG